MVAVSVYDTLSVHRHCPRLLVLTILSLTHFIEKNISTYHMKEVNYAIIFHNGSNGAHLISQVLLFFSINLVKLRIF